MIQTAYPRIFSENSASLPRPATTDHALTLLIPAYNEENRLPATLAAARDYLDDWGVDYRVVVVDNGSRDRTGVLSQRFGGRFSTIHQPVCGKGAAVRKGMLLATGAVVAFTDADLPYDLAALRKGYQQILSGESDVVYGSRSIAGAEIAVKRRWIRSLASFAFRCLARQLISRTVVDTQCGLKLFSHEAARRVFSRTTIDGFAFDTEVVFLVEHLHLHESIIPVTLINEDETTLSLTRHTLPMLRDMMSVRWRALLGGYQTETAIETTPQRARRAA